VLAAAVFAGVTTEMLPVGLLPAIADSLQVSESTTGLLVSFYAVMVALGAVPLAVLTRGFRRKRLLLAVMGCYTLSNVVAAAAPTFAVLAVGRAIGGLSHALFFSVVIGYAVRLVPPAMTGRALALVSSGASVGFVLGVPLATALGNAVGWHVAFWLLAALMLLVLALIAVVLPDVDAPATTASAIPGQRGRMALVVTSNALAFVGHFTLYTYVSVLLLRSGATQAAVAPILLVFGVFGLVGVWFGGPWLDRSPRTSALLILGMVGVGILAAAIGYPHLAGVVVAGAVWNGAWGPVSSVYQVAAVRTRATSPELAGAWINATSNVGIAVGAAIGGRVLAAAGIREDAFLAFGAVIAAMAVFVLAQVCRH